MSTKNNNSKNNNNATTYNAEITNDDIQAIGKKGLRADSNEDRLLLERDKPIDFEGKNLDVPGRDNSKSNNVKTIKDEENTLYAQGGENKDNLEAPERANTTKE